jgi:hypothetical protein
MSLHPTPHQLVFNHSSTVVFIHRVFLKSKFAEVLKVRRLLKK